MCGSNKKIILLLRYNKKNTKVSENNSISVIRTLMMGMESVCGMSVFERFDPAVSPGRFCWAEGALICVSESLQFNQRQRSPLTGRWCLSRVQQMCFHNISRRMTGCCHPSWRCSHGAPAQYMLLEMLYVFSPSVAAINGSPVFPPYTWHSPAPRHTRPPPPVLQFVYLLAAVKLRTYLRDSPS